MWAILKFDKKKKNFLKRDLQEKLGKDYIIYTPKILVKKYRKNIVINKEISLLGDYLFCFHKNFKNPNIVNQLKFVRGLKYFLEGFLLSQNEIQNFVNNCKELEDTKGYITQNIFELIEGKKYKFLSGPFADQIFKIIQMQKNKINILIGNLKTRINKKEFLFYPV